MSLPLVISPEAEIDLIDARDWYAGRGVILVAKLVDCVEEAFDGIRKMPTLRAKVYGELRMSLVRRFPYAIVYRVDPA